MGVTSVIRDALSKIKKAQKLNRRLTMMWKNRVLSIANEVGGSQVELLEGMVSTTVAELENSDSIEQRSEIVKKADKLLNNIQPPAAGRRGEMDEADKQDYEAMEEIDELCRDPAVDQGFAVVQGFDGMCYETALSLRRLHDRLPTEEVMQDPGSSHGRQHLPSSRSFNHLRSAMANLEQKWATMQLNGLIDPNLSVVVFHLEEPDPKEAIRLFISLEYTFAEVAVDLFLLYPTILLADFWVKRADENFNRVTESKLFWEWQSPQRKVCEAPVTNNGKDSHTVHIVVGKKEYVVVLINDNGIERGKAVELPYEMSCASKHMEAIFENYKISKILDLRTGTDASGKTFNKLYFLPNSNTLYVELEPIRTSHEVPSSTGLTCEA